MVQDDSSLSATKQDLNTVQTLLKQDIQEAKTSMKEDLNNVQTLLKQDIQEAKTSMKVHLEEVQTSMKQDLATVRQSLQDQLNTLAEYVGTLPTREEMKEAIQISEQHILTAFEQMRHDVIDIHKGKFGQHEDRIVALEVVTGLRR